MSSIDIENAVTKDMTISNIIEKFPYAADALKSRGNRITSQTYLHQQPHVNFEPLHFTDKSKHPQPCVQSP